MIVLDTAALIYWTALPDMLSEPARRAIAESDSIVVSSISIWEIALKSKRGRIDLPVPPDEYIDRLRKVENLEIRAVDMESWLAAVNLDWKHRDPADRVIVATATLLDCPLISSDRVIGEFYAAIIW